MEINLHAMKLNIDLVFLFGFLIVSNSNLLAQYGWPFSNSEVQHQINAVFGEVRGARNHFHQGIDIQGSSPTEVYAIEAGIAYIDGYRINIGHFSYIHLMNYPQGVYEGAYIQAGQLIGYTDGDNHVHLTESNIVFNHDGNPNNNTCLNPLRPNGLTPFAECTAPVIENVTVYRQGTEDEVTDDPYYGRYDISVRAYDPGVSPEGNPTGSRWGIYRIRLELLDGSDQLIGQPIEYLAFDELPANTEINWAYAEGSVVQNGVPTVFIYWSTNDPFNTPYDKYWNTKQRKNCAFHVDARDEGEAVYKEGVVKIRVVVEDMRGNIDIEYVSP